MTTDNLREFLTLAEAKRFTDAADNLYLSVSTLSRHIMSMERGLPSPLFIRSPKGLELSETGRQLLPHAQRIIEAEMAGRDALAHECALDRTPLNIGCVPDAALSLSDGAIKGFVKESPLFKVNIFEAEPEQLKELINCERCDFAFVHEGSIPKSQDIDILEFGEDRLVAVVPKHHELASCQSISVSKLSREPLLLISENTIVNKLATDLCLSAGFTPNVVLTSIRTSILTRLVSSDVGLALVMKRSVDKEGDYTVVDLEEAENCSLVIMISSRKKYSFGTRLFLRHLGILLREEGI